MVEDLKACCIIYIVTPWVILFHTNSKSIQNWKQNLQSKTMSLPQKFQNFRIAFMYIPLWLVSLYCSDTNLQVMSTWVCFCMTFQYFGWDIFIFYPKLQRPALKADVLWCKTGIYSWNLSEKLSLLYEDSSPVPHLCNLKYVSLNFIHNSMKSSCK